MNFISPEGQAQPLSVGASPRPHTLQGLRIGFLDNAKAPVDKMMAALAS